MRYMVVQATPDQPLSDIDYGDKTSCAGASGPMGPFGRRLDASGTRGYKRRCFLLLTPPETVALISNLSSCRPATRQALSTEYHFARLSSMPEAYTPPAHGSPCYLEIPVLEPARGTYSRNPYSFRWQAGFFPLTFMSQQKPSMALSSTGHFAVIPTTMRMRER
jgi:hypothetical protein